MTLEGKICLVKNDLLSRHPNCPHTIKVLFWDDGTDQVTSQYGDGEKIYRSTYYNNELTYTEKYMIPNLGIGEDGKGNEFYVMSKEQCNAWASGNEDWVKCNTEK